MGKIVTMVRAMAQLKKETSRESIKPIAENYKPCPLVKRQPTLKVASSWHHLLSLKARDRLDKQSHSISGFLSWRSSYYILGLC